MKRFREAALCGALLVSFIGTDARGQDAVAQAHLAAARADGNQRHMGGMLGGDYMRLVQEGVQLFPDMQTMATTYIASVKRFKTLQKLAAVRARRPGDPNPFVNKDDVDRFLTMEIECAEAQRAWARAT